MARLAGELADVAITWLTPAAYLADTVVPALRAGAGAARPVPWLTAIVPMSLERPGRDPADAAHAGSGGHLRVPHYLDMLNRAGAGISAGVDPRSAARALVSCGAFLSGDASGLRAQLAAYTRAGADEVVINLTGIGALHGQREALAELAVLLRDVVRPEAGAVSRATA